MSEPCLVRERVVPYYGKGSLVMHSTCRMGHFYPTHFSTSLFYPPVIIALLLSIVQGIKAPWKQKAASAKAKAVYGQVMWTVFPGLDFQCKKRIPSV